MRALSASLDGSDPSAESLVAPDERLVLPAEELVDVAGAGAPPQSNYNETAASRVPAPSVKR